jgi:hypothetical protein
VRWVLVWWVVHPGHYQNIHLEPGFVSEAACTARAAQLEAPDNAILRWHCSIE